jgi:hypothetical protein
VGSVADAPGPGGREQPTCSEEEMTTGKKAASDAGRLLRKPSTPKAVKTVAASAEAQAKKGKRK